MMKKKRNFVITGWLLIISFTFWGCIHKDKGNQSTLTAEIKPGIYHRISIINGPPDPIATNITQVIVDREIKQVIFRLADGTEINASLGDEKDSTWGEGCPTNVNFTQLEILFLREQELTLDGVTFSKPVLVATCPSPPSGFFLLEADDTLEKNLPEIDCEWWNGAKCIYFAKDYARLKGQIVNIETNQILQDADIVFSSPAGRQSFSGNYQLSLPAGAVIDFSIHAPGFQDSNGQVEISHNGVVYNTLVFRFETGVYAKDPAKAISFDDPNEPIVWDFPLTPEPPLPTPPTDSGIIYPSKPRFQVFILNPVSTCIVGNDFASGNVCRGPNCGDCNCTWDQFDPPAPLSGVPPSQVNDPQYADFEHKVCVEITLTQGEIDDIIADMNLIRDQVYDWSGGALDLQMEYTILPHDHIGFVAPEFVFGPFEVDDELLNPYVTTETDFVYVVSGVYDRAQGLNLSYACGGSYGEMSIHGAGYANIQYNDICNSVTIDGQQVYEPLIHEWMHNLDWALYEINQVPDLYQQAGPDWANWKHASWPACGKGADDPTSWFPSVDFCEWDPDWRDCNNVASAGACLHAGEVDGEISWYEHVISAHYPRDLQFIGNYCRDGGQDVSETGIDQGWPCP
jgi:hypothetical protein